MGDYRLAAELIDQLQSQLTTITTDRDNLRERLGREKSLSAAYEKAALAEIDWRDKRIEAAEGLLHESAHAGNLTPGGWLQLQLKIVGFLSITPSDAPAAGEVALGDKP